ncbi:MAG: hypothetical protein ACRDUB_15185 [Mycobacterium sp.]
MSHVVHAVALPDLPPARDFVLSAGFAGVATLLAAVIVACAVLYASRRSGRRSLAEREQRDREYEERRADERQAAALARCWERWWQVLDTAGIEPSASEGATLGLGPEVTLELLRGLLRDAEHLGDDTLTNAIAVYQQQLLLVLAQQSGPLSQLAQKSMAPSANGEPRNTSPREPRAPGAEPDSPPTGAPDPRQRAEVPSTGSDSVAAASEEATGRRRRR